MAVRQKDDRPSWKISRAARVLIIGNDDLPLDPRLRRRILQWMQRSPENLLLLLEIMRIDRDLSRMKLLDRTAQLSVQKPRTRDIFLVARRAALFAGAAIVALFVGLTLSTIGDNDTAIQHVTLADGSVMHVLRGSDADIEFSDETRLINLPVGEAVFEVAKDPDRPFIVRSTLSDSIAIGTRFGVATDASATTTTVSEGEVRVVMLAGADVKGTSVKAGEELRVAAGTSRPGSVLAVNAERKISWSAGWLEFDGETVGEAVSTFNRFSDVRIELTQPELSGARLTYYRFSIDKPESFAVAIGTALNAPVARDAARNVIYIGDGPRQL